MGINERCLLRSWQVLREPLVPASVRKTRAKALKKLGSIFQACSSVSIEDLCCVPNLASVS